MKQALSRKRRAAPGLLDPLAGRAGRSPALGALTSHWPEYLMEAAGLGLFMVSACLFVVLLEHPASPLRLALHDDGLRRALVGVAMGATAVAIIYSPWGKQSGAHLNPAVTLTFLSLGRIAPWDAAFYVLAQFAGAVAGMGVAALLLGVPLLAHPAVNFVATLPGAAGTGIAFAAEFAISAGLMALVLAFSNTRRINRYTGLAAGALIALYIAVEAPLSGMSMNPARSFGSALWAQMGQALWIYFTAPPLGMLLAAAIYRASRGAGAVLCCKLHHDNDKRCIFHCRYGPHGAEHSGGAVPLHGGGQRS